MIWFVTGGLVFAGCNRIAVAPDGDHGRVGLRGRPLVPDAARDVGRLVTRDPGGDHDAQAQRQRLLHMLVKGHVEGQDEGDQVGAGERDLSRRIITA